MKQLLIRHVCVLALCISSLCMLITITACSSGSTTPGTNSNTVVITGAIQSISAANHSATISFNGQSYTINGLTDAEVTQLQSEVGKTYQISATHNADGSYTITAGTNPVANANATPGITVTATSNQSNSTSTPGVNQPGSISYIGTVQNISSSSITVNLPSGDSLTMVISALTDRSDFGVNLPQNGQQVKVDAITINDGVFTVKSLGTVKPDDAANPAKMNTVEFKGVATSAVGADNVVHFRIGSKDFSYTVNPAITEIKGSLQAITANTPVKLKVQFNGSNGTVLKVESGND